MTPKPLILVVDDTDSDLDLMVETLASEYEVAVATNGVDALDLAREQVPHLIILDIMMPGTDGFSVMEKLREDPTTRDTPVIFVTAKSDLEDEALGFALGAVDYVTKPVSPPRVRARVAAHLALRDARVRLEEQNRELVRAARLREDVESIMRHDLKTPLNGIIGLPQVLLMDSNLTPKQRKTLEQIEDAGRAMLDQINSSVVLLKIERGSYCLTPRPVDMLDLVRRVFQQFTQSSGNARGRLSLLVDGREPGEDARLMASGEESLLQSMLSNLVQNALEAPPREGPVVVEFEPSSKLVMRVSNPGVVPEDVREFFFEKFVTSGKIRGTGLGTYSAKLVADIHGGTIGFTTDQEQGTTVTVTLP